VPDLKQAIEAFMQAWNKNPKPFIWTRAGQDGADQTRIHPTQRKKEGG
jgi:hypothetical protein